jgi:hypothetical protein
VPADKDGRLVKKSTPRLAKLLHTDYVDHPGELAARRFVDHHQVQYSKDLFRQIHNHISSHLKEVENRWTYCTAPPEILQSVATVMISRDGAMAHMRDGKAQSPKPVPGWRECMCGVIALYNAEQECIHTTYVGVGPQKDKPAFTYQLTEEVRKIKSELKSLKVEPTYVGVADGAATNWTHLEELTQRQVTDYFHVSERLAKVAEAVKGGRAVRQTWLRDQKDQLLEHDQGVDRVIESVADLLENDQITSIAKRTVVEENLTYLRNQKHRMNYYDLRKAKLPIGSGPVEAGCKTLIKSRLCGSGMRWLIPKADDMLISRSQILTGSRNDQYWAKRMRYGAD